tara:strand:- start:403 stop:1068 length:666 start_codon:yes stop_codon:yes gene_type:complete
MTNETNTAPAAAGMRKVRITHIIASGSAFGYDGDGAAVFLPGAQAKPYNLAVFNIVEGFCIPNPILTTKADATPLMMTKIRSVVDESKIFIPSQVEEVAAVEVVEEAEEVAATFEPFDEHSVKLTQAAAINLADWAMGILGTAGIRQVFEEIYGFTAGTATLGQLGDPRWDNYTALNNALRKLHNDGSLGMIAFTKPAGKKSRVLWCLPDELETAFSGVAA